jgi:hypothetical protein
MQSNADSPSTVPDRFSPLHFAWWLGLFVLYFALWEFDKATVSIFFLSVLLLPPLLIGWLVGTIANAARRRWRRAASAFLAPLLAGTLAIALPCIGLDSERIHFLLVKYPHEIELHFPPSNAMSFHSWDWGLDAPFLGPGVAYMLNYDPTDAELHEARTPDKSIRPMGDHFYIVTESEDGSAL